jgi:lysophospholipase L1-like esterase
VDPVLLFFASGESLYPGAVLLLASMLHSSVSLQPLVIWFRRLGLWIGLAFVIMASPPQPWCVDALLGFLFVAWLIAGTRKEKGWSRVRVATTFLFTVFIFVVLIVEFLHRRPLTIQGARSDHLVVIGDSMSAGLGTRVRPWPEVMREKTGAVVANLSKSGATMRDGLAMAERVTQQDHLVLIELGGNDLIAGESSAEFERSLESVLARMSLPGRTIVMFELPLLPQMVNYGRVQRRLATKYSVWLIPKRYLTSVISGKDATSDGLHLTDVGARRMATLVSQVLSAVLERPLTTPATHP